jgi:CBS domain-containing protein
MNEKETVERTMTRDVVTLLEEESLVQVRDKLSRHVFHHLPVVDGNVLVGMLSDRDMLQRTGSGVEREAFVRAHEARYLEQTFVRDIMNTDVVTIMPEQTLQEAATRMLRHRVGALPVVTAERTLIGIITEKDIVRRVAMGE